MTGLPLVYDLASSSFATRVVVSGEHSPSGRPFIVADKGKPVIKLLVYLFGGEGTVIRLRTNDCIARLNF